MKMRVLATAWRDPTVLSLCQECCGVNGSAGLALRALLFKKWQEQRGHSCDLGGPLPGQPGAVGCLAALSASLWDELISSRSVAFARDAAGLLVQE